MKTCLIGCLCLLASVVMGQKAATATLSGEVREQESGETLIGASVLIPSLGVGATTNEYGFYSLTIPADTDSVSVVFSYVGYQPKEWRWLPQGDTRKRIELSTGLELAEVVVKANSYDEKLRSTEMSVETVNTLEVALLPAILGETDILKAIQLKPGIPSGGEGTTGLFVRGGGSDQNLIVLDEATVYNAYHLFGFFSTFNTDAVKDLRIYKGGFPARYGGRLSSVIDVKLKEGNNKKIAGSGGLGLLASRLTLEGPIQKEKSSFIVSGRRTYFDLITRQINESNENKEGNDESTQIPDYYFYDLNAKVNIQLGEKDRLFLSGYFGRDVFGFDSDEFDFNFDWGNSTGTARWNHTFSPKLFSNTTFTYSDYQYNISNRVTGFSFSTDSNIEDVNFKTDFFYAPNNVHNLRFGLAATAHKFEVGRLKAGSDDGRVNFTAGQELKGQEFGVYVEDDITLNAKWGLNAGLRFSGFVSDGQFYSGVEPRLAVRYLANDRLSLKGSYAYMSQYLHLVASAGLTLPTDIWYPSTKLVKPQRSQQVALGGSYLLSEALLLNSEVFYKRLYRQLEFVDGAQLFANDNLEQEFAVGNGRAYGWEVSLEKQKGKLRGWVGYTWSRSDRYDFKTLNPSGNFGQARFGQFAPIYDRRHDISIVGFYELSRRLTASATWVYGSGDRRWLPLGRFTFQDLNGGSFEAVVPIYEGRNDYRLPAFHRLDLGLVWKFFPKWGESDLTFNVINAYNRRNVFFIFLDTEFANTGNPDAPVEVPERVVAKQVSLFPILPSITWNFKF